MTNETTQSETMDSDILMVKLRELDRAPIHRRGDASLCLASLTVAAIRRLEVRITELETKNDRTKQEQEHTD